MKELKELKVGDLLRVDPLSPREVEVVRLEVLVTAKDGTKIRLSSKEVTYREVD